MQNEKIHKRGRYSAEFKEKVALEALSGAKTHAKIASEYGISPDLVKDWKKQAKEMLDECFRRGGRKSEMEKKDERIANLERLLGKREFELDWLSKKAKELGLYVSSALHICHSMAFFVCHPVPPIRFLCDGNVTE
ncbi:MAG: transposase [Akkermansia sp.]|nr:transposase [Akkermansia sp.]